MVCSPPVSSVHGSFQARILEWVAISSSRDFRDPGIEPASSALAGGFFFTTESPGKPCKCLCQILNVLIYLVVTDCHEGKWYYYSSMNVKTQINKSKLAHLTNCRVVYQHESPKFLSLTACTLCGSLPPTTHPLCESTLCYFYLCDYSFVIFCEGFFSLPYSFLQFQHPFPVEGSSLQ